MKIIYLIKTRTLEKHNVIKLFLDVFKPRYEAVEIVQASFFMDSIYVYIVLDANGFKAKLYLKDSPELDHDIELKIYQDIKTIPLMNNALIEFKRSQLNDN